MTGKAQIVNSSFAGPKFNALTGSREITGTKGDLGSMIAMQPPIQYQSTTSDQVQFEHFAAKQGKFDQNRMLEPRQFSAVQFRKNDNSVGHFGGIGEVNVRVAASDHNGFVRGSSQNTFPTQHINFGAHQQSLLSGTQKGQPPLTAFAANLQNMNEDSHAALAHPNSQQLAMGSANRREGAGDLPGQLSADQGAHPHPTLQMKMEQQTSEVRMSTQMGIAQVDDFADRTGGAPSHEDAADLYQLRPQI